MIARTPAIAPLGNLIADVGVEKFVGYMKASLDSQVVSTETTDFAADARALFGALSLDEQHGWSARLLPTDEAEMVQLAETDQAVLNALLALSPVAISKPSYPADLALYNVNTGTGNITDDYLADRAAMLNWRVKFDTGQADDNELFHIGRRSYSEDWDSDSISDVWEYIDKSSDITLTIDGDGSDLHRIIFGSALSEPIAGGDHADRLYGGGGDDRVFGGTGADYLEGGTGNDKFFADEGDILHDSDGKGKVEYDGEFLHGGKHNDGDPTRVYKSEDGRFTYRLVGTTLTVKATGQTIGITIQDFIPGDLGIFLDNGPEAPGPVNEVRGTAQNDHITIRAGEATIGCSKK